MASKHSSGSRSIVDVAGFPDYIRKFLQNSEVNESDPTAILQLLIKSNLVTLVQQEGNETIISIKPDEDLPLASRENLDRDNSTLDSPACASSILQDWEFTQEELLVPDAQPVRDNVVSRQNRSNSTGNISVIYASSTEKEVSTNESNPQFDSELTPNILEDLLKKNIIGNEILELGAKGCLSERRKLELAGIVAEWHLSRKNKTREEDLAKYAKSIVLLFKNERQNDYYLPKGGDKKNPGGKIYNKINTIRTQCRKRKLDDEKQAEINKDTGVYCEKRSANDTSIEESENWLKLNDGPWSTVLDKWKASFLKRKDYLAKCHCKDNLRKGNLWKFIRCEYGYQLIDIDFRHMELSPNCESTDLNSKWKHVLRLAGAYITHRTVDEPSLDLINILNDVDASQDSRI
ncbi:uncharacterized protein LOC129722941 isoform X2 [Wyeomyia smithii]|uniref:uncharacterized protein LOC129722941 isoform X2 n=1 Tax=Wyeomyia smithii TaxID=174621 RepID=UPI002467CAF2|nr:uncharacterized protein LOC129722941 isoform X2 [Wyeomyia smithii]